MDGEKLPKLETDAQRILIKIEDCYQTATIIRDKAEKLHRGTIGPEETDKAPTIVEEPADFGANCLSQLNRIMLILVQARSCLENFI